MKYNITTLLLALATLLTVTTSCKSSKKVDPNKVTTEIPVNVLTGIEAHNAITVKFSQTDSEKAPKVTVTCRKSYATNLNVRMEGTTLVASFKGGSNIPESGVEVVVTAPSLNKIVATSAATVNLGDELKLNGDLSITTSSAGSVKGKKVGCQHLSLDASSAAQIQLSDVKCYAVTGRASSAALILLDGEAETTDFQESTAAEIRCPKLTCQHPQRTTFDEQFASPKKKTQTAPKAVSDTTKKAE